MTEMDDVRDLLDRWTAAEVAGDTDTLDAIAVDQMRVIGPVGFVLDKAQWLDRYRSGDLRTTRLLLEDVDVRVVGDTAISIAVQDQTATHRDNPADGRFRTSHVLVRTADGWRLLGQQLSLIRSGMPQPG